MNREYFYLIWFLIGLGYWAVNIFIRKLHTKNEHGEGWFLVPIWLFFWPICWMALLVDYLTRKKDKL